MNLLFAGFDNLSDDEIRGQIALLKCVTFSNTIKERGQMAVKYFVEAASGIFGMGQTAGGSSKEDTIELLNIRRLIDNTYNELNVIDREQLNERLKQELIDKISLVSGKTVPTDIADDGLYVLVVREAAKVYSIDENSSPARMADEIHNRYYDHYLKVLQRKLMNLTPDERVKLEQFFQKAIPKANIHQMRQLAGELMLREFNGKTILTKLMVSKGTNNLKKVIDSMGLGAFDGIEGVLNTAYDSMLMFCRIERAILAQCVWMAVNGLGKKMELKDDLMPSYTAQLATVDIDKERKLLNMIAKEKQMNAELKSMLAEIDRHEKNLISKEKARDIEKERLDNYQSEYRIILTESEGINSKSDKIKNAYEDYIKKNPGKSGSDPEYRRLKMEYESQARDVRGIEYRITTAEKNIYRVSVNLEKIHISIDDINKRISELREELVEYVMEFNKLVMELENEACYMARVLERRWDLFYVTLKFDRFVHERTIKSFTQREIVAIEKLLTELDQCEDKENFALRKDKDMNTVSCTVATGKCAVVYFDGNRIADIKVKGRS